MHLTTHPTNPEFSTGDTIEIQVEQADDPRGIINGLVLRERLIDSLTALGRDVRDLPAHDVERMLATVGFTSALLASTLDDLMAAARDHNIPWRDIAALTELPTSTVRSRVEAAARYRPSGEPSTVLPYDLPTDVTTATVDASGASVGAALQSFGGPLVFGIGANGAILDHADAYMAPTPHIYIGGPAGHGRTSMASTVLAQQMARGATALAIRSDDETEYGWADPQKRLPLIGAPLAVTHLNRVLEQIEARHESATPSAPLVLVLDDAERLIRGWRRGPTNRIDALQHILTAGPPVAVSVIMVGPPDIDWMPDGMPDAIGTAIVAGTGPRAWRSHSTTPLLDPMPHQGRWVLIRHSTQDPSFLHPLEFQALRLTPEELSQLAKENEQ